MSHVTTTAQDIVRAGLYQRISLDKAGDEHGVANQLADQKRTAGARGYTITLIESDNDISALTGKRRPGYERIMAAAAAGEIDVILVFQTSRFWRYRRQRAEGIEILRKAGVSLVATRGPSLDMSSAYGRAMAGLLGEFDTMESEVKSERQQLANRAGAEAGKARKGTPRPFGWQADRITLEEAEAGAIHDACTALLAGGTITGIVRDWEKRGVRPHQMVLPFGPLPEGTQTWTRTSVRLILSNPRNAGIAIYKGAETGRGEWEAIVPEETYRAVAALLADTTRKPTQGVTTLLGGIGLCRCGNYVRGSRGGNGQPSYRCHIPTRDGRAGPHVFSKREPVDDYVGRLVVERLSRPDAAGLVPGKNAGAEAGVTALRDEANAVRVRLARLGALYAEGTITEADLTGGRAAGAKRLAEIDAKLAGLGRESVLSPLLAAADVQAAWDKLSTDRRRAVVDTLMVVTLHPAGRGARAFSPDIVTVEWRKQ